MPWTQADRDILASAVASGVLSVSYSDRSITYQSLEAMRALLSEMDRQVLVAPTHRQASHVKGV